MYLLITLALTLCITEHFIGYITLPEYDTNQHLVMMQTFRTSVNVKFPFCCRYSQVLSDTKW